MALSRFKWFKVNPFASFCSVIALAALLVLSLAWGMTTVEEIISTSQPGSFLGPNCWGDGLICTRNNMGLAVLCGCFSAGFLLLLWLYFKGLDFLFNDRKEE